MKPRKEMIVGEPRRGLDLAPAPPAQPAESTLAGFMSDNTKKAYERDLKDFFGTEDLRAVSMERIAKVQPEDVITFRDRLLERLKPGTVTRKLSAIRALYNNLIRRGVIRLNPADPKLVRSPKRSTVRKTGYLSWDEAKRILRAPNRQMEIGKRDYAMLVFDINTGLRRSELCHLKDADLVRTAGQWTVRVRGKGEKDRFLPLRDDVHAAVEAWRRVRPLKAKWLFTTMGGERLSEDMFWKIVRRYAEAALGAETAKKVHPHALRAAYIAFLLEKGVKVDRIQQLVGHSRGDTTLGYVRELDLLKSGADKALEGLS